MAKRAKRPAAVFRSYINSFHYLYGDAEYLHNLARRPGMEEQFEQTRLCRTAVLLYILSLEGLINRALDHFLPDKLRDFFIEREQRLSVEDKWLLLPLLASDDSKTFNTSQYPWSHFSELVTLRNEFVHPKHDRPAYYYPVTTHSWKPLEWKRIPKPLGVKEKDIVFRQTGIPRDPYAIKPPNVDAAKRVVDDTLKELDRLLGGRIFADNWAGSDNMELVYPAGAILDDLPAILKGTHRGRSGSK